MMRYGWVAVLVAGVLAACAGTPPAGDEDLERRRAEVDRELERECRINESRGFNDPRCPARQEAPREPLTEPPPLDLPQTAEPQFSVPPLPDPGG